jgi:hypothetical protein
VATDVLERDRSSPLRVFVVWAPNVPGDSRDSVDRRVLGDRRVTSFWDERGTAEQWFAAHVKAEAVSWDAYFVFGPRARWASEPDAPVSSGSPVFNDKEELETALAEIRSES